MPPIVEISSIGSVDAHEATTALHKTSHMKGIGHRNTRRIASDAVLKADSSTIHK